MLRTLDAVMQKSRLDGVGFESYLKRNHAFQNGASANEMVTRRTQVSTAYWICGAATRRAGRARKRVCNVGTGDSSRSGIGVGGGKSA